MIEIKKVTRVKATFGKNELYEGLTYAIKAADGKCYAGTFKGITKHSALEFEGILGGTFALMPKSIEDIIQAGITPVEE